MLILASIANGFFGTVIIEDSLEMPLLAQLPLPMPILAQVGDPLEIPSLAQL